MMPKKKTFQWDLGDIWGDWDYRNFYRLPRHPLSHVLFKYCTEAAILILHASDPIRNVDTDEDYEFVSEAEDPLPVPSHSLWINALKYCPRIKALSFRMGKETLPTPSLPLPLHIP